MENASKALLIAGAILIAIVLITFGVLILGQGGEVIQDSSMSDAEVTTFNAKFTQFEGTNVRGNTVKQLYKTVLQHNLAQTDEGKKVEIEAKATTGTPAKIADLKKTSNVQASATGDSGETYTVKCSYKSGTGLVEKITVTENETTNQTTNP